SSGDPAPPEIDCSNADSGDSTPNVPRNAPTVPPGVASPVNGSPSPSGSTQLDVAAKTGKPYEWMSTLGAPSTRGGPPVPRGCKGIVNVTFRIGLAVSSAATDAKSNSISPRRCPGDGVSPDPGCEPTRIPEPVPGMTCSSPLSFR